MALLDDYEKIISEVESAESFNQVWKDVTLNYLKAHKALEQRDLALFKSAVNISDVSSYLLFTSPEFLGAKDGKDLNSDTHPIRGSVYLDFPSAEVVESLGSIYFGICYESENLTKDSPDWLFFKSVADYLTESFFPVFENNLKCHNDVFELELMDVYADFKQLWNLYIRFLTINDLDNFKQNEEKFVPLIEVLVNACRRKNGNDYFICKYPFNSVSVLLNVIDFNVFKGFLPEFSMVNLDRLLADVVLSDLSHIPVRNAIYLIDNYPERLMDDLDVTPWSLIYKRLFNSQKFRKDYGVATIEVWKKYLKEINGSQDIKVILIGKLNSLLIAKYKLLRGAELKPEFLIAFYWFGFYSSLNQIKMTSDINYNGMNRSLNNMLNKEPIIQEDIKKFKEEYRGNDVAENFLTYLEL